MEGPERTCADRAALPGALADLAGAASRGTEATARGNGEDERGEMPETRRGEGDGRWPRLWLWVGWEWEAGSPLN